ncbi:hypothetical protein GETHLI_24740 [Geothrix limicola]|uniref:Peptidase S54 rhomboid domain-containing protein n=1 Tax=Geothrix limicola TaxID=2927978 RepID=A0ABQ5QGJ7_9BACT|nr:rhomboid family intramembrane serine protease [Geothrix limicola]GLH73972.1 hypothetical protein GETHLI_24740 [Geothrix limicola]
MDGSPVSEDPTSAPDQAAEARLDPFQNHLAEKAPTPWLTLGIIGANIAVFLAMLLGGVSLFQPDVPSLLHWGANQGALTTSGQWWRLFTCTFLHIGLIHILFNMAVLWGIGRFMERLLGRAGFATLYVLSGIAGSIASMWWNPYITSAGASGAIFGLYGGLIGYLLAGARDVPPDVARKLRKDALVFLGYNLVWGLTQRGLDMAGHLGGLAGGLACGAVMARCLHARGSEARLRIALQVLVAGLALLALAAVSRPRVVNLQQELAHFTETETQVRTRYNAALERAKAGALADADFARLIETDVLPPWHSARLQLKSLRGLPEAQANLVSRLDRYAETRERAWAAFAEALLHEDMQGVQRANALHADAEAQLKALGN